MAYTCPRELDGFVQFLLKPDTRLRQQVGTDLIAFLGDPSNSVVCQDIGHLIDGLIPWMQSSNFKVSSNGLEVMTYLIDRLGTDFKAYLQTVLPNVIDRLGDAKDTVREKAQLLILKLLERNVLSPQTLLEKLLPGFSHKNAKIREEVLRCLVNTLNEHGTQSLQLNRFIPDIVKLLSDPTSSVRDTAYATLVDLYKHVGEKLRVDLQKRNLVPAAKWPMLSAKFDEVKQNGELLITASRSMTFETDEMDRATMIKPQIPPKKPHLSAVPKARVCRTPSSANSAGALDEDAFLKAFDDVPAVQIFSSREVIEIMKNINDTISDQNKEWNKRQDALKKVRSLVIAGGSNYEEFFIGLKQLEIPLQASIRDLRSQIVREACITISFLSQNLGNKFDKTAEFLLPSIISLIPNSAKIMSTSGTVAVQFLLQSTHHPRLIPILTSNIITSKSKEIRRSCCEFLELILSQWRTHSLEKHISILQEALKKGVADADPEARVSSRKAFRCFKEHFPDQAEALLQSLDPSYRRALQGEHSISASSSNSNLYSYKSTPRQQYYRPTGTPSQSVSDTPRKGFRSNSAIDLQAAQRAKARAQYAAITRNKVTSGTASLPRPKKIPESMMMQSPERARTRSRNSQSQPTSRSASPSSKLAYLYRNDHESPRPRRLSSGIPRSTTGSRDTSRETSPNRGGTLSRFRTRNDRPPLSPASRPVMAQKILQQSREAENALADAFNDSGEPYRVQRRNITHRSLDNHSDESETSSICSERSFDSFKRPCDDIGEILAMCASPTWQERKEGLHSLQYYLTTDVALSSDELKMLTDIFTKMFMDSHTKGMSVFLDTLHEVIKTYKNDLQYWVYVLLQRVFLKIGTEILNSVQTKLLVTLDVIRANFSISLLIWNVYRFLVDSTQTPNVKVKSVVLNFLTSLCNSIDSSEFEPPSSQALVKIISFTQDQKSTELRNAARICVVAMWNCNTPQITMMLGALPKDLQEIASNIVHNHMRKSSTGSEPNSPLVTSSPKPMSPTSPLSRPDGIDQEEIYRSLRKTTAEIQNYSYETLGAKLDRDRDTTSQDSGISQMSIGNDIRNHDVHVIEERMHELLISSKSGPKSLPYCVNGVTKTESNGFRSLGISKPDVITSVLDNCVVDNPTPQQEKRHLMSQLIDLIREGQTDSIVQNFRKLLRIWIDHLNEKSDPNMQMIVLQILTAMFQCRELQSSWCSFAELLILRVLEAHSLEKREVVKEAEITASAMVVCPFRTVISTLAPIILTSSHPTVLGAIKMLTKVVEAVDKSEIQDEHLAQIMPGLIRGTDHVESPVRKSSIFCIVALYMAVGDNRLEMYINRLSGSKIKLLKVYITKAEQTNSVPTSPKNTATS